MINQEAQTMTLHELVDLHGSSHPLLNRGDASRPRQQPSHIFECRAYCRAILNSRLHKTFDIINSYMN